jgi:hypothetical protein
MALGPPQIITVPFTGGVDEKTREENLPPGTMRTLDCLQMTKSGGYSKTHGDTPLAVFVVGGGVLPNLKRVFGFRGEALATDGVHLYSRVSIYNRWRNVGKAPACTVFRFGIAQFTETITSQGIATAGGYIIACWTTATSLYWSVIDGATYGTAASGSVTPAGGGPVAAIGVSNSFPVIFYTVAANTNVSAIVVNLSTLVAAAPVVAAADGYAGGAQSLDVAQLSDRLAIVYNNNSGGVNSVSARTFTCPAGVLTPVATNTAIPSVNPPFGAVSIGGSVADELYVAISQAANVTTVTGLLATTLVVNGTAATVSAFSANRIGIVRTGATTGYLMTQTTTNLNMRSSEFTLTAGAIVAGTPLGVANLHPYSRPFLVGSRWYAMAYPYMANFPAGNQTSLCVDINDFATTGAGLTTNPKIYPVATIAPRLSAFVDTGPNQTPAALSATKYAVLGASLRTTSSGAVEISILDFASQNTGQPALYGDLVGMSGGTPYYYDGADTGEMGFVCTPALPVSTPAAGALTGTYSWCVTYEHVDAGGQIHRSAPSPIRTAVLAAQQSVLTCSRIPASARVNPVMARLWRTIDSGSVFYQVPIAAIDVSQNNASTATINFASDNTLDSVLQTKAPLYTQPGVLGAAVPRVAPPSLSCLIAHADRMVGVGDDGRTIWVTGQRISGDGVWWSDAMQYPQERGPITALASMDGRIVAWTRDGLSVLDGQGPPDNAQGGDYVASSIVSDVGCINPRSVVVTSGGVLFDSLRGFERMNRSLQVENYFGASVEDTRATYPIVTSAVLRGALGRVVFSCVATEGAATGTFIEYDYTNNVWTICPREQDTGAVSAAMVGDIAGTVPTYTWVTAAGAAWQESASSFQDNEGFKPSSLVTPWIHVQGLTGWQQIDSLALIAQRKTAHGMVISVGYDYEDAYTDVRTWTHTEITALATSREILRVDMTRPECIAIRVKAEDTDSAIELRGTGEGAAFVGLQLIGRADDDLTKLPDANRK